MKVPMNGHHIVNAAKAGLLDDGAFKASPRKEQSMEDARKLQAAIIFLISCSLHAPLDRNIEQPGVIVRTPDVSKATEGLTTDDLRYLSEGLVELAVHLDLCTQLIGQMALEKMKAIGEALLDKVHGATPETPTFGFGPYHADLSRARSELN